MTAGSAPDLAPSIEGDGIDGRARAGTAARAGLDTVAAAEPSASVTPSGAPAHLDDQPARRSARRLLPLVVVAALAVALRVLWLDRQSLFVDEHAERVIAALPWSRLLDHPDGFPPLWFFLAHGWLDLFGFDASLRWLSVVLGVATVLCCAGAAGVVGGRRAAVTTGAVTAVSPLAIWHAQESRPYSLVLLLAAALAWAFLRLVVDPDDPSSRRGAWLAYGAIAVAGAWTHYFFALPVGLTALLLLARPRTRRAAVVVHGLIGLACLPLIGLLRGDVGLQQQLGTMGGSAAAGPEAVGYSYLTYVAGFSVGPSNRELHEIATAAAARAIVVPLLVVTVLLGALAWWAVRHRRTAGVVELALAATVPVLAAVVVCAALGVGFRPRYVNWGLAPLAVLAGCALARARVVPGVLLGAVFLGLTAASLVNRNQRADYKVEDLRAAVAVITASEARSGVPLPDGIGDPVAVVSGYLAPVADFYVAQATTSRQVIAVPKVSASGGWAPDDLPVGSPGALALGDALASLPRHRPFWLLVSRSFHDDPDGLVVAALRTRCRVSPHSGVAGVTILRVEGTNGGACDATTTG